MMAYLIDSSTDDSTMHASLHGLMSSSDFNYFRDRFEQARSIGSRAGSAFSNFMSRAKDTFDNFDLGVIRDGVELVRNRFRSRWDEDRIQPLYNDIDLQQAKSVMRSYLMTNPRARKLYYENKISGFDGEFFNEMPNHHDYEYLPMYQNVMQGAYVGTEDEDRFITYLDVLENPEFIGDHILNHTEREDIKESWDAFNRMLDLGEEDPSSTNSSLL